MFRPRERGLLLCHYPETKHTTLCLGEELIIIPNNESNQKTDCVVIFKV